jgi:hypothetical protein
VLHGRRALSLLVPACAALFVSAPAAAYVRTRSADTNAPFFWRTPQVVLEVARPSDAFAIAAGDVRAAALAAIETWSYPAVDCTSLALTLAPGFTDGQIVAYDGHNRVIVRTGAWCRDPDAMSSCHDPSLVALTTVFSRSKPGTFDDGQILEADIEVNDVGYEWAVIPDGAFSGRDYANSYDLQGALTHEVGHFIGLAHDCLLPGDGVRVDERGILSPECATLSSSESDQILSSTMYAVMSPADVSWRSLSPDDTRAVCAIYSHDEVPVAGWCAVGGSGDAASTSTGALAAFVALATGAAALRRRRRVR